MTSDMYATGNGRYQRVLDEFRRSPWPPGASTHRTIVEHTRRLYNEYHNAEQGISALPGGSLAEFARRYKLLRQEDTTRLYAGARVADDIDRRLLFEVAQAEVAFADQVDSMRLADEFEQTLRDDKAAFDTLFERMMDAAVLNAFAVTQRLQLLNRDTANPDKVRQLRGVRSRVVATALRRATAFDSDERDADAGRQRLGTAVTRIYDRAQAELADRRALVDALFAPDSFVSTFGDALHLQLADGLFDSLLASATVAELAGLREADLRVLKPIEESTLSGSGDDEASSPKRRRLACDVCGSVGDELFECDGACTDKPVYCSMSCQGRDWSGGHWHACSR